MNCICVYNPKLPIKKEEDNMEKIFQMKLHKIYPLLVNKCIRKGRTQEEVDTVICWYTGYTKEELHELVDSDCTYQQFFEQAHIHPHADLITGVVCKVRVETIENPLLKQIRQLDKVIDELAKGKKMEKILR